MQVHKHMALFLWHTHIHMVYSEETNNSKGAVFPWINIRGESRHPNNTFNKKNRHSEQF